MIEVVSESRLIIPHRNEEKNLVQKHAAPSSTCADTARQATEKPKTS